VLADERRAPTTTPNRVCCVFCKGLAQVIRQACVALEPIKVKYGVGATVLDTNDDDTLPHLRDPKVTACNLFVCNCISCFLDEVDNCAKGVAVVVREDGGNILKQQVLRHVVFDHLHDLKEENTSLVLEAQVSTCV